MRTIVTCLALVACGSQPMDLSSEWLGWHETRDDRDPKMGLTCPNPPVPSGVLTVANPGPKTVSIAVDVYPDADAEVDLSAVPGVLPPGTSFPVGVASEASSSRVFRLSASYLGGSWAVDIYQSTSMYTDLDSDGLFVHLGCDLAPPEELYDCDDNDPTNAEQQPSAERPGNGIDDDCDNFVDE